jgi:hypothetical protein
MKDGEFDIWKAAIDGVGVPAAKVEMGELKWVGLLDGKYGYRVNSPYVRAM